MLIAIAADLHDNLANWQKFQKYIKKQGISTLLFCGDLTNSEMLEKIRQDFSGDIFLIAGNQELYQESELKSWPNWHFLGRYGATEIDGLKIGLIHEPYYQEKLLKENKELDYIFYGHTHKPWIEQRDNLIIANPGTLGGVFYKASFAVLDTTTKKLDLKILEII